MNRVLKFMAGAKKFLAAATGAAAVAISVGLLSGTVGNWVTGSLAIATAFIVYLIPNAPAVTVPDNIQELTPP